MGKKMVQHKIPAPRVIGLQVPVEILVIMKMEMFHGKSAIILMMKPLRKEATKIKARKSNKVKKRKKLGKTFAYIQHIL